MHKSQTDLKTIFKQELHEFYIDSVVNMIDLKFSCALVLK